VKELNERSEKTFELITKGLAQAMKDFTNKRESSG
jgi:hypothetical protein